MKQPRMASIAPVTRRLAAITGICLLAGGAHAQLQGENLLQPMPAGYRIAFQDRQGGIVTTEMVPEKESSEEWTEMLTTQLYIGLKSVSPAQFRAESQRKWLEACKEGSYREVAEGDEKGYPVAVWLLSCPYSRAPGRPEMSWFKAIRGNDAFYVVQKSFRFEPSGEQAALWMRYLRELSVCDTRLPDRPCPKVTPPES